MANLPPFVVVSLKGILGLFSLFLLPSVQSVKQFCYFQAAAEKKQNDSLKPSSIDLTAIHMEIDEVN